MIISQHDDNLSTKFEVDGYILFCKDRQHGRVRGVGLYVRISLITLINESVGTEDNVKSV